LADARHVHKFAGSVDKFMKKRREPKPGRIMAFPPEGKLTSDYEEPADSASKEELAAMLAVAAANTAALKTTRRSS
jgi:hypothetical protein